METRLYLPAAALACLGALAGISAPPFEAQVALLVFAVAVFGLPHGALDPLVARRAGLIRRAGGSCAFHLAYGAVALAVVGVWVIAPGVAFTVFLAYSAYHFAGDWIQRGWVLRLLLGAAVLSLPAMAHPVETARLYALLAGPAGAALGEAQSAAAPIWGAVMATAIMAALASRRTSCALELMALTATGLILPPLIFFALYFCLLHSPRHFLRHVSLTAGRGQAWRTAAIYTVIAAAGAVMIAGLAAPRLALLEVTAFQTVFIALAALTAPHLVVCALSDAAPANSNAHALPTVN